MDKYTRVKKIGEGAFGKALLVKSNADGNQYVIKEINMTRMPPKEREASRKEVLVLAQLKHPHIVAYRESFEEHGSLYIVMDYCSGGDLYSKINSQRGIYFQEERIWTWFAQICLAIKHIHDRKILHRDIKSQNIFICGDGKVQIGDFGIAKVLNSTVELARTCIGTPYYLSPELVENKPYNNKSDIWSLGCVLYELTTLKHAFEAGNMKNLVLKIIRGSYPPIPTQYSYELRGLIAQLFKRSPRDRPSINSILKKNFMLPRVRKILSEEEMEVEFSHTVMHGHKMGRALPPPPRPSSAAAKRPAPQARPSSAQGRYNPAAVYGQPLVKKSKDFKPNVKKRPGSAGRVIPGQQDWEKKKQNLVFKERKRREEQQKKDKISPREVNQQPVAPPRPLVNHNEQNAAAREKGKYDNYHAYLDKLQHDRPAFRAADVPQPVQNKKPGDYMQAPPEPAHMDDIKPDREFINRALNRPPAATPVVINHVQQAEQNRKYAAEAAERAKILEEFMQRKREAALNKMKGMKDLYGPRPGSAASDWQTPRQPPPKPGVQPSTPGRNREEQEYLQKLRQIREQNMKERRMLQNKYKPQQHDPKKEAEERRKKMQALRQQADDWAQKKKDQLEKEKKEIMDRMRLREQYMKQREAEARQQKQAQARPVTPKKVDMKPAPAVPITGALNAIGAGAQPEQKNPLQQKKNEILKRLNEKPPGGRGKWGAPASPMAVTEEDDEEPPVSARPKWGEAGGENLGELPLEQTASQMEVTSAQDQVIKKGAGDSPTPPKVTPRNQWGKPGGTVVGILQGMPICEGTVTIDTSASGGSGEGPTSPPPAVPGVGETITISKPTVNQGTIVIQSNQEKSNDEEKKKEKSNDEEKKKENAADVSIVPSTTDAASNADSHRLKGTFVIGEAKPFLANQKPETIPECCEDTSTTVMEEINKSDEKGEEENISDEMNEKNDNSQNQQLQQNVIKDTNVSNENLEEKLEKKEISGDDSSKSSPEGKTLPISVDDEEESKEINMTDVSFEEDIHTDITTKHQQPLRLPKPKLLPKPVLPEIYFEKGPEIVKSEKGGSLFEKVELEDDEDEKKKNTADEFNKSVETEKFVCQAITTGQFDIKDIQMMRTVSEPDLSKINESEMKMPFAGLLSRHLSLDEVHEDNPEDQNEEEEEEMSISPRSDASPRSNTSPRSNASSKSNSSPRSDSSQKEIAKSASSPQKSDSLPKFHNSSKSEQTKPEELSKSGESKNKEENEKPCTEEESVSKHELNSSSENAADKMDENEDEEEDVENEDDDDDDEEDDDLISVRATMQSLLIDDGQHSSDDDDQTKSEGGGSRSLPISQETDAKSDTDEAPHGEHKQEMLAGNDGHVGNEEVSSNDASKDSVSGSADSEDISTEGNDLFDDSDAETLFGDDDDDAEDYDLFSRLEQARQELEEALGFEKFIEVYKAVEALQEDEDDNVQEGARIVIEMLGKEKEHLYPRIFQLVIADTAFTDDNA